MTSVACLSAVSIDETFSAMECTGMDVGLGCDTLAVAIGDIVMVVLRYHRFCEKQFFFCFASHIILCCVSHVVSMPVLSLCARQPDARPGLFD